MSNKFSFLQLLNSCFDRLIIVIIVLLVFTSCVHVQNFTDTHSPIWTGKFEQTNLSEDRDSFRVVSYNIKLAKKINETVSAFKSEEELKDVDLILLQEMDTIGTMKIAKELNLNYVYIPAAIHGKKSEYFGNSILSNREIVKYEKLILPHHAMSGRQRIAMYAALNLNGEQIHIYNIHLETMTMKRMNRAAQLQAILNHSKSIPEHEAILIAGDFNSFFPKDRKLFASLMKESGFNWHSNKIRYTAKALKGFIRPHIDQVFSRGLNITSLGVADHVDASDHFPIYFDIQFKK